MLWFYWWLRGIVLDINKFKEDVLKRGDDQVEVNGNDGVEKTWKDDSDGNLCGNK